MMMPCAVNSLLYVSSLTRSPCGVASSSRISAAATAPRKKKNVIDSAYSTAMRLWSRVVSQSRRR